MAGVKLLLGAAVALVCVAGYWINRPSPAPSGNSAQVAVVNGMTPKATETHGTRPEVVKPVAAPTSDAETRRSERNRISQQILPLLNRTGADGRLLHDRLVSERRDDPWADKAEDDIHAGYNQLEAIGKAGRSIDVQCSATLCEVSAALEDRPGSQRGDAMHDVQDFALIRSMAAIGYDWQTTVFGKGADGREMFVTYFTRSSPKVLKLAPQ